MTENICRAGKRKNIGNYCLKYIFLPFRVRQFDSGFFEIAKIGSYHIQSLIFNKNFQKIIITSCKTIVIRKHSQTAYKIGIYLQQLVTDL